MAVLRQTGTDDLSTGDDLRSSEDDAWLRRIGFPEASKHTVGPSYARRGMDGLVRGPKTRTTSHGGSEVGEFARFNETG